MGDFFSDSYQDARTKMLAAANHAGARRWELQEPGVGVHGEFLVMDVIEVGPQKALQSVLVTSACHGVEGYAGSALQLSLLRNAAMLDFLQKEAICLVLVHALNPHGFSYSRRVTAEGVDLNRNAVDFNIDLPVNEDYKLLHPVLIPKSWPPDVQHQKKLASILEKMGMRWFQDALTRGQYEFEEGLFFGGKEPTWSLKNFDKVLKVLASRNKPVVWIDLHTGLGPTSQSECIFTGGASDALQCAKALWGNVTELGEEKTVSSVITGALPQLVRSTLGPLLETSITWEMGTVSPMQVLYAMCADAYVYKAGIGHSSTGLEVAAQMRQAFCPDSEDWRNATLNQGGKAIGSALKCSEINSSMCLSRL